MITIRYPAGGSTFEVEKYLLLGNEDFGEYFVVVYVRHGALLIDHCGLLDGEYHLLGAIKEQAVGAMIYPKYIEAFKKFIAEL
jgi:hypothetical protein